MNLSEARHGIAAALSKVGGFTVSPRPLKAPRMGDGWVVITRLAPADFRASMATLTAVLILGSDEVKAEQMFEQYGTAAINAVTSSDLNPADVSVEAQILVAGQNAAPLYAIALTLTVEVI